MHVCRKDITLRSPLKSYFKEMCQHWRFLKKIYIYIEYVDYLNIEFMYEFMYEF